MARSRKKNPYCGWTCKTTEKQDKRIWNRKYRSAVRTAMANGKEVLPIMREVTNVWDGAKDGKQYFGDMEYSDSADDRKWFKMLMRK